MLMSDAEAATAQCSCTEPALVSSVAAATGEALPVAAVSLVMALAVIVPPDAAPNGVALIVSVATAVPGAETVPDRRNTSFGDVPSAVATAPASVLRSAVM